jgi:hypothetical protein
MAESNVVNRWVQEARAEARIEQARLLLIRLLERKFPGQVSPGVVSAINVQPSLAMLEDWFDQAAQAAWFADFVRFLRA